MSDEKGQFLKAGEILKAYFSTVKTDAQKKIIGKLYEEMTSYATGNTEATDYRRKQVQTFLGRFDELKNKREIVSGFEQGLSI